jgi:hypothetical protein
MSWQNQLRDGREACHGKYLVICSFVMNAYAFGNQPVIHLSATY